MEWVSLADVTGVECDAGLNGSVVHTRQFRAARRTELHWLAACLALIASHDYFFFPLPPFFPLPVPSLSPFASLPEVLPRLADGSLPALCHVIDYPEE